MPELSRERLDYLLKIMHLKSIEYFEKENSYEIRLIPELQQACNQIREIIQEYFKYTEEVKKSVTALKKMRKRIQNQPEVDEEFIEKWASELSIDGYRSYENAKKIVKQMLQEAGYNVIKKKL